MILEMKTLQLKIRINNYICTIFVQTKIQMLSQVSDGITIPGKEVVQKVAEFLHVNMF